MPQHLGQAPGAGDPLPGGPGDRAHAVLDPVRVQLPQQLLDRHRPSASSSAPRAPPSRRLRVRFVFQETDQAFAQRVVLGVLQHGGARARARERHLRMSPTWPPGRWSSCTMRSDRNSASSTSCVTISAVLRFGARVDQHLLQLEAGQRIEHAEWLVEQQHLGLERKGARDADALAHARRQLGRALCIASARPDARRGNTRRSPRAPLAARGKPARRPASRSQTPSSTAAGTATGTPRRGPDRARRSPCRRG